MSMASSVIIRARFEQLVELDDNQIPLARAALTIAHEEYPDLDRCGYERRLALMARSVRSRCGTSDVGLTCLAALDAEMYAIECFRGNSDGYYDPRNSFLNDVMDRRLGLPITLSIIYLDLCWRLGISAVGVGMPGHFIVLVDVGEPMYVDPFDRGTRLDLAGCEAKFHQVHGSQAVFHPTMLAPVGRRQILFRLLANLKGVYLRQKDYGRALAAIDRMLHLRPDDAGEHRDRAWICQRLGHLSQACADYRTYLQLAPRAPDYETIREALATVVGQCARPN